LAATTSDPEKAGRRKAVEVDTLGRITSYVVDWDILNNLQDTVSWLERIDIYLMPSSLGTRVTLDSDLDAEIGWSSLVIVGGIVTGGEGSLVGVYGVLDTMVEAHSRYVECLLLSYGFPLN
jgi:hypothetical protein